MQTYHDFLNSKLCRVQPVGFEPGELNANLFDWQADLVRWFCRVGRVACFADTGLGKTLMQLEWCRQVLQHASGSLLILAPLAVAQQTKREAEKFGVDVPVTICREQADVRSGVNVTNYERLHKFDATSFGAVVLDESSILKAYTGKTKRRLVEAFANTPYRLACTATPAPNDHMELGNHSEFLGLMSSREMLATWFKHDSGNTSQWRLKRHGRENFWEWVTSWAACVGSPSELGYSDDGFQLPPLRRYIHEIPAENCPPPDGYLFHCQDVSATNMHKIKRATAEQRAAKVAELIDDDQMPWLVWCDTNYEADALRPYLPEAVEVRGSDSVETKEGRLIGFSEGRIRQLITKPEIAGHGLNWQHCHKMVFMGLSFSFERLYQAIRRCWRYGQIHPVQVHIVGTDAEVGILETVDRKTAAFQQMRTSMAAAIREGQLKSIYGVRKKERAPKMKRLSEGDWCLLHGDCVKAIHSVGSDIIGFSVFSPPFANLYVYSDFAADLGNSRDYQQFFEHFNFLVPELYRVTMPGRLVAFHCAELPLMKEHHGVIGMRDFPGDLTRCFEQHGWIQHSPRLTIWKDPLIEATRTKALGLLHKQLQKDSAMCRTGTPDYIIVMRKPGENAEPIRRPNGLERFIGANDPAEDHAGIERSHYRWRDLASPVWMNIRQGRTLNYRQARAADDEAHVCPLQLDVIERCIELWSNPGDVVFSPFAGIGSEGYCAIRAGRRFLGCELKDSYVATAVKHLRQAANEAAAEQRTLFNAEDLNLPSD